MNILDIAQNSVQAKAKRIEISLTKSIGSNLQTLVIKDDGTGMSEEMLQRVADPFCTTRTTRKVGLGLPFLKMAAELTGGKMHITSTLGIGTTVSATFALDHIDLMPLGDMAGTISALVQCNPEIDFVYTFVLDEAQFVFDTRQAREILGDVSFAEPAVALFIRDYVAEQSLLLENTQKQSS